MFSRLFLVIIVGITASLSAHAVELGQIASPNGRLTFTLQAADTTDKGSPLTYTIAFDGQILVEPSILNLRLADRNGTGSWNALPHHRRTEHSRTPTPTPPRPALVP